MKQQFVRVSKLKQLTGGIAFFTFSFLAVIEGKAQMSTDQNDAFGPKQKMNVDMRITPSVKEFRAGITTLDSSSTKLRLWVCNAGEKRCTVTISNDAGILWNNNFRDAYYNQVYDLSSLDDGEYKIEISDGKKSFERTLLINSATYFVRNVNVQ